MNVEDAITYCDGVEEWEQFDAECVEFIRVLVNHAKSTRWRKPEEERPTSGLYLCRCVSPVDGFVYYRVELATPDGFGFQYPHVTEYQRIVKDEDET